MEQLWRPNFWHIGRKAELFTHVIYDFDVSPFDLILDAHHKVEPMPAPEPEPEIPTGEDDDDETNVVTPTPSSRRLMESYDVKGLREYVKEVQRYYKTKHILLFIGSKTNFEDGDIYFEQLDQLISEFNSQS